MTIFNSQARAFVPGVKVSKARNARSMRVLREVARPVGIPGQAIGGVVDGAADARRLRRRSGRDARRSRPHHTTWHRRVRGCADRDAGTFPLSQVVHLCGPPFQAGRTRRTTHEDCHRRHRWWRSWASCRPPQRSRRSRPRRRPRSTGFSVVARGLDRPTGIAIQGSDELYFTELPTPGVPGPAGGRNRVSRLDLESGEIREHHDRVSRSRRTWRWPRTATSIGRASRPASFCA